MYQTQWPPPARHKSFNHPALQMCNQDHARPNSSVLSLHRSALPSLGGHPGGDPYHHPTRSSYGLQTSTPFLPHSKALPTEPPPSPLFTLGSKPARDDHDFPEVQRPPTLKPFILASSSCLVCSSFRPPERPRTRTQPQLPCSM